MSSSTNLIYKNDSGFFDFQNLFDFFGRTMSIQIAGKNKQSSFLGAFLGVISIIAIVTLSTYFLVDLFQRNNINVMYNQNRDLIPINNMSSTPMIFTMIDPTGKPIDSKGLYNIDVILSIYSKYTKDDGTAALAFTPVNISYSKCNINSTFGDYKNLFKDFPFIDQAYCITPNSYNLTLYGRYSDVINGFSFINFYVNKCVNGTTGSICVSEEQMELKLSNSYFAFSFLDYQIDHQNSSLVFQKVIKTSTFSMTYNINKIYFFYIRQVLYNTDVGLIFQDKLIDNFYQQDNYQLDVRLPGISLTSSSNFGIFSILNENKVDFYYRSYTKFQSIIANIGGVVEGIFICCRIINYIFTRNLSCLIIANSVFDFEVEKQPMELKKMMIINSSSNLPNIQLSTQKILSRNPMNNQRPPRQRSNKIIPSENKSNLKLKDFESSFKKDDSFDNNKQIYKEKNDVIRKKTKLKINLCALILPTKFNYQRSKMEVLENCENIIRQNLSVHYIIEKFFYIDKIKTILEKKSENYKLELNSVRKPIYKEELERLLIKSKSIKRSTSKIFILDEK